MNKRTFSELKKTAKSILSGNYWNSFAVYLLFTVILGAASYLITFLIMIPLTFVMSAMTAATYSTTALSSTIAAIAPLIAILFTFIALIPVYLFVEYPLYVGMSRHFLNATNGQSNVMDLFFPYKNRLGNVILIMFLKSLYIFLWSMLFVIPILIVTSILGAVFNSADFFLISMFAFIPGIIKTYEYSMIEFILAENPAIDRKKAFKISKAMTDGNKFRIFLFSLSFIGWILLGALTFGIGTFFIEPYVYASMTQLYIDLRENAIAKGTVTPEDLTY